MALLARVWRKLLAPAFWAFVVLGGITIVTLVGTGANDFVQLIITDPLAVEDLSDTELWDRMIQLGLTALVAGAAQLIATGFVNLTAHRIVAAEMAGAPISTREAVASALRRFPTLLLAGLVATLAILAGLALFVVPGVWLGGIFTMLSAVIALEGAGAMGSIRRSMWLVRGRWWPTVGFVLMVGLLGSAAAQLVQLIALPALTSGNTSIGAGLAFVVLMVIQGFVVAAIGAMYTRWYVDLRARKEPLLSSSLI
jgi:hypothetical protein